MLCPVEMERRGLKSALEEMAASTEEIFNVSCKLLQKGYFIVDDIQIATHLFYIAREAVNNAIKHGKPKNIYIYLSSDELYTSMIIRDDGKGITDTKVDSGMGLRIMRYRANIIGAEFYTGNHEDGGYQLEIRLKR